jgi:hypothetical protein
MIKRYNGINMKNKTFNITNKKKLIFFEKGDNGYER